MNYILIPKIWKFYIKNKKQFSSKQLHMTIPYFIGYEHQRRTWKLHNTVDVLMNLKINSSDVFKSILS